MILSLDSNNITHINIILQWSSLLWGIVGTFYIIGPQIFPFFKFNNLKPYVTFQCVHQTIQMIINIGNNSIINT